MKYIFYIVVLIILYIAGVMIYNSYNTPKNAAVEETQKVELEIQNSEIAAEYAIDNAVNSIEESVQDSINSVGNSVASVMK